MKMDLEEIRQAIKSINERLLQMEVDNRIFYYCLLRTQSTEAAEEFRYRLETIERERKGKDGSST